MVWVKAKTHLLAGTKSGSNMGVTLPHPPVPPSQTVFEESLLEGPGQGAGRFQLLHPATLHSAPTSFAGLFFPPALALQEVACRPY